MPIRRRLALVCAALVSAMIVGLGTLVYLRLESDLMGAVDDELRTRAATIIESDDGAVLTINATDVGDIFAQRIGPDGAVVAATPGFSERALMTAAEIASLDGPQVAEVMVPTPDETVLTRRFAIRDDDGTIVVTGVTIDDQRAALGTLLSQFAIALPIAIVLAGGVGWLVAAAALRPVERIRVEAEAMSGAEPDRRLPVPETQDELTALGVSLNRMLDRIQATVERERRFVDDASHELRTPLTNLKLELELALMRSRDKEHLVAALQSAKDETDRLVRLAEDLLVLARAADARLPIQREFVDAAELARATAASFAGRAASLGLAIDVVAAPSVDAMIDPVRIRQALGNLLDNALRNSPAGRRVTVTVTREGGDLSVVVVDAGRGFPAEFVASAFEPFTRADPARGRAEGGAGLGLAIVRAVAEAHGGVAVAANLAAGGAEVSLRLPA